MENLESAETKKAFKEAEGIERCHQEIRVGRDQGNLQQELAVATGH